MKYCFTILMLFFSVAIIAQNKPFTISGIITGHDCEEMRISYKDDKGVYNSYTTTVTNGAFSFSKDNLKGMEKVSVGLIPKDRRNPTFRSYGGSSTLEVFAFPGAEIKLNGKVDGFIFAYSSGDQANDDLTKYNKLVHPLLNESVVLSSKISQKQIEDSVEVEKTKARIEKLNSEVHAIKKKFIYDNPASVMSAWLLQDMMLRTQVTNEESVRMFDNLAQSKLNGNRYFEEAAARVKGISATAVGKSAPEINSLHTYDGKPFRLSSLKGKYVVLDFWGTWCGPCISGMPRMKEYLDKYSDKMVIVGVASESDDGTRWREFLDKNTNYHWYHVLSRNDDDLILKYSVAGFPTKIIIDSKGKVVERFVGEDDAIYNRLDEILN